VLAFREIFGLLGAKRIGLVTPYRTDVQERIRSNWGACGFACRPANQRGKQACRQPRTGD